MFIICDKIHKCLNNSNLWPCCFVKINHLKRPALLLIKNKSGEGIEFAIQLPE